MSTSDTPTETPLSVDDVRHELSDFEDQDVPEATILYHLGVVDSQITNAARDGADPDDIASAVALNTAVRIIERNKEAFLDSKSAADVSKSFDVETWWSDLKEDAEDARDAITGAGQPSMYTLGGRVPRGHSRTNLYD